MLTPENTTREHFIPLRKADLVRALADDAGLDAEHRRKFLQLCQLLEATFHYEYHERLDDLKDTYAPFDPDADTVRQEISAADRQQNADLLFDKFIVLLERANYVLLTREQLLAALDDRSFWGVNLDVDFDVFDRLEVFARGDTVRQRTIRRLRNRYRVEEVDVPSYRRLVLIFRPRNHRRLDNRINSDTVYIKIFKDIPKADLEMLLPGTKVKMTLLDQSKILMPAVSGVAITIYKIIKGALVLAFAGIYGILAFVGLLGGTVGYAVKSFLGYLRAKDKYQLNLTRSLYFQNLDNNAGVLYRLLDEAEEQELREAVLAYFLLWREAGQAGWSQEQLDTAAESYLRETIGIDVDFEVDDALAKFERLRLVDRADADNLRAVPIEQALINLDRAWDGYFQFNTGAATSHPFDPPASHKNAA